MQYHEQCYCNFTTFLEYSTKLSEIFLLKTSLEKQAQCQRFNESCRLQTVCLQFRLKFNLKLFIFIHFSIYSVTFLLLSISYFLHFPLYCVLPFFSLDCLCLFLPYNSWLTFLFCRLSWPVPFIDLNVFPSIFPCFALPSALLYFSSYILSYALYSLSLCLLL